MFKRVRWVSIGAVLGAGGSVYAQVRLRRTAQRYLPPEVGARVADRARKLGEDVQAAVLEGRLATQEREAELRARLDPSARPGHVRDAASRPLAPVGERSLRSGPGARPELDAGAVPLRPPRGRRRNA